MNIEIQVLACEHCRVIVPHVEYICPCQPRPCTECEATIEPRSYCVACRQTQDDKIDEERFRKATKIPESTYTDMVYEEGADVYHSNVDCFRECLEDDGRQVPSYVWATSPRTLSLSAEHIVESGLEEAAEDSADQISASAISELQDLLDAWCAKYSPTWVLPDYSTAVLLDSK